MTAQQVSNDLQSEQLPSSNAKFYYLISMFFLISFVYNILQPLKKSIIMNAGSGAEILPYLKPFAVVPCSILITWYFLYLTHNFDRNRVFRVLILTFMTYFALYSFVLRPFRDFLAADTLASMLEYILPDNFQAGPAMVRYWMDTIFYVAAELWGSAVLNTLLWGIVNEITSFEEAKKSYAYFTVGANCSGIFSGQALGCIMAMEYNQNFAYGSCAWDQCFLTVMLVALSSCCLTLLLFRQFVSQGYSQTAEDRESFCAKTQRKVQKKKMSLSQSLVSLTKSSSLLYIAIIVVGYNLVYNLSDVVLNKQIHLAYADDPRALNAFLAKIDMYKAFLATFLAIFVSRYSLKKFGWTTTALVTPVAYLVTATLFYSSFILNNYGWEFYPVFIAVDPTLLVLYLGGLHFCATKGAKYSLFDATKEMAYLSLDKKERTSGKAVIDGIASRFGKSGGSFVMFILFAFVGNDISLATPYIFGIVLFIAILWILAVVNLGKKFSSSVQAPKESHEQTHGQSETQASPATV